MPDADSPNGTTGPQGCDGDRRPVVSGSQSRLDIVSRTDSQAARSCDIGPPAEKPARAGGSNQQVSAPENTSGMSAAVAPWAPDRGQDRPVQRGQVETV